MNKSGNAIDRTSVDVDGVRIADAYKALSQEAFALWIRMHTMSDEEMSGGRAKLAKAFSLSEGRSNAILRELLLKGYLSADAKGPPHPTTFRIAKRCKLVGRDHFIRLSARSRVASVAYTDCVENDPMDDDDAHATSQVEEVPALNQPWFGRDGAPVQPDVRKMRVASEDEHWHLPVAMGSKTRPISTGTKTDANAARGHSRPVSEKAAKVGSLARIGEREHTGTVRKVAATNAKETAKKAGEVNGSKTEVGTDCNQSLSPKIPRKGLDLSRMREAKEGEVERKRDVRDSAPRHPDSGQPINWDRIDLVGKPVISFTPTEARRKVMLQLITAEYRRLKPSERKLRTALVNKLRSEFIRIYTRYRRAANMEAGRLRCQYMVAPEEQKYAEKAAIACLIKGVTPRELLEYWHQNIKHFRGGIMKVPSLTFLSQPSFVDEVAVNGISASADHGVEAGGSKSPMGVEARRPGWRPPPRRTPHLGDTSQLHPKLRAELMGASFDMSKYNDSDLATIQDYAIEVMSGKMGIKMIPEGLRPMIEWATKNTLKDVDPRDFVWRG